MNSFNAKVKRNIKNKKYNDTVLYIHKRKDSYTPWFLRGAILTSKAIGNKEI